ncbi:M1 family metallopeptidase [Aureibaculum sp. 2210JD6-5]|uniref:M1 family metallopeptidase n=1 Tax=Aureibaculum sp. 2210JD6-5 TaxID=3103957 RepID=UPI002AACDBF9|nr:M1 family metallopeptidase [Aureibaculum sp. 2210JD6-5]MDY7396427.1 M1 family metallopeptidase [Aureibaculum sp. 2210JD6-5]
MRKITSFLALIITFSLTAQNTGYWQQHVDYTMEIDMNVENYQYDGTQKLVYTNNSPDTLDKVFYHLQFNAFQPGSDMDIRLQNIADPDGRMVKNIGTKEAPIYESRIAKLKPDEIGFIKVNSLKQDGKDVKHEVIGTILKVTLNTPILPGAKTVFDMNFKGQVPLQIRRSGRNSEEGVALSMAQWYPKLAEYDFEGWQANQYIAREFHGVWGNFDVKITIDKNYTIGGSGYLQNPDEIGHGYSENEVIHKKKTKKLTWHFKAPNVHDFTWAADPDYIHDKIKGENDVTLHFLYKNDKEIIENWKKLQPKTAELLSYFNKHIGQYPYKQYSVIQGGDGGMEYAMCTLITGGRNFGSLVGVTAHELAHSWFQFLLATNEIKHEWMDEGFTSYFSSLAMNDILNQNKENPSAGSYRGYLRLAKSGIEEPLTTYADHYTYNYAYSNSAYSKGAVFLAQLGYIIGEENLQKTIKKYYNDFKFKHPTPNDIKRTAEKVSGLQLDWYLNYFAQTTATIDYAIDSVKTNEVHLKRIGKMPMPIDLKVVYTDGTEENFYIPLRMMLGGKPTTATILNDWSWVAPTYTFSTKKTIKSVEINPSKLMADVDDTNNSFSLEKE